VEKPKVPTLLSKPGAVKSEVPSKIVIGTPPITRFVAVMLSIVVVREPTVNTERQLSPIDGDVLRSRKLREALNKSPHPHPCSVELEIGGWVMKQQSLAARRTMRDRSIEKVGDKERAAREQPFVSPMRPG